MCPMVLMLHMTMDDDIKPSVKSFRFWQSWAHRKESQFVHLRVNSALLANTLARCGSISLYYRFKAAVHVLSIIHKPRNHIIS